MSKKPFNSNTAHFVTKAKAFCANVIPLVFDNSLSYYEQLCHFSHKLNECIEAINAHSLNIIEFEHMVQLEIEKFESYIESRVDEFENEIKTAWETFKSELQKAWEEEKQKNENFRNSIIEQFNTFKSEINARITNFENDMLNNFNNFKNEINNEIERFETSVNGNIDDFKTEVRQHQTDFEHNIVSLFNAFKSDETAARSEFENNFQQLFETWKINTLNAFNSSITSWESETGEALKKIIDGKFSAYQSTISSQLSETNRHLTLEVNDRKAADENLQNQINQLTPEGAIKADTPDSNGNSQLYTVNPTTQERTNIFPVTNNTDNSGGTGETPEGAILNNGMYGDSESYTILAKQTESGNKNILPVSPIMPVYLLPNTNRSESYLKCGGGGRGVMWHYLYDPDDRGFVQTNGVTDLGNAFINISISKLYYEITTPEDFFGRHRITHYFCVENDGENLLAKCKPTINYYWARIENGYFKCGVMLHCSDGTPGLLALKRAKMYTCVDEYLYSVN